MIRKSLKIYYDAEGNIIDVKESHINATSSNVDVIEAYADFPTTGLTATITLRRADGLVLGPFKMLPVDNHHEYTLDSTDTAVSGPIQTTIRYDIYSYDDVLDEMILMDSKVMSMYVTNVYETVGEDNEPLSRLAEEVIMQSEEIRELRSELSNFEIPISVDEPDKKAGLWMKIVSIETKEE